MANIVKNQWQESCINADIPHSLVLQPWDERIGPNFCPTLLLMNVLPTLWETFMTTAYESSMTNLTHATYTCAILFEDAQCKTFAYGLIGDACNVQTLIDR